MVGDYEYTCILGEEDSPPYENVLCEKVATVTVNAAKLAKALKRLNSLIETEFSNMRMTVKKDIELAFTDLDGNEVTAEVETTNRSDEARLPIGVDPDYLLDTLIGLGGTDEVEITIYGPFDPIRVDAADGRIAIVMPKRL
jgi:DNA polymerase III sliding clamp (beta) subunit (PCNA family)